MSFHGDIPGTFEGQVDWYLDHLNERGVEGYFGKGTVPGMPDMPSSSEYAQQVYRRAGVDPRTAGIEGGGPAVDPYSLPNKAMPQQQQVTSQGGGMQPSALENPWLQMGLGVLSNIDQPGLGGIARGIQQGGLLATKMKYERELMNAKTNRIAEPTALERQLQSAGLVPGTPAYSAAIMQYLYKPSTQVNIGGENPVPLPEGAMAPVNPKDLSKGYIYPDERSPTGTTVKVPTGTITPTEGEAGKISSLVGARQALDKIESLSAAGANITDLGGVVSELMAKPNLTGAAAREVARRFGYEVDENTAGALVEMARQTALISAYISGADVPIDQKESFQEFLPRPGDPPAVLEYKLKSTRDFLNQLEGTQNEMRGRTETPDAATSPVATPGGYTAEERAIAAKLGITLP
jgi:hypothetical protein